MLVKLALNVNDLFLLLYLKVRLCTWEIKSLHEPDGMVREMTLVVQEKKEFFFSK